MRKANDDLNFGMLHHCCIHSHTKTYSDKAVEKGKPKRGQGKDRRPDNADKQKQDKKRIKGFARAARATGQQDQK